MIRSALKGHKIEAKAHAGIYKSHSLPGKWSDTGMHGAIVLVRNAEKNFFQFKLVDLGGRKDVIWASVEVRGDLDLELRHSGEGR